MRYYIAGPMSGCKDFNYPAFHAAAAAIRSAGHECVNPAEMHPDTTGRWEDYMRADIAALMTCEAVAWLPDYWKSAGARLEIYIASSLHMPVHEAARIAPLDGGKTP